MERNVNLSADASQLNAEPKVTDVVTVDERSCESLPNASALTVGKINLVQECKAQSDGVEIETHDELGHFRNSPPTLSAMEVAENAEMSITNEKIMQAGSNYELSNSTNENEDPSSETFKEQSPKSNHVESSVATAINHLECIAQQEQQRTGYDQQLEELRAVLQQKENMISLLQRENSILEKEKHSLRKEKELANREKESTVIKFAMKEKLLIDAKKEKEGIERQLAEAKKEIKNVSTRFQSLNEEKTRITSMMDEKCNEVRKYQREYEKLKTDYGHLDSKLKYHINKLNLELEAKQALEKKLEEEKNSPNKNEEKANEQLKVEYEANTILLKHEIEKKDKIIETLTKEQTKLTEKVKQAQEQFSKELLESNKLAADLTALQQKHEIVQNAYSEEMLTSAKLRGQLDELQLLRTQNTLNEEKIATITSAKIELDERLLDNRQDLEQLRAREQELLSINKEMSESIVGLQNEICLLKGKVLGIGADNDLLKKERQEFDEKYDALKKQLDHNNHERLKERQLLTKHLSEKTKLNEITKIKLENALGDMEAAKRKHAQVVKELQREALKYKTKWEQVSHTHPQSRDSINTSSPAKSFADTMRCKTYCNQCQKPLNGTITRAPSEDSDILQNGAVEQLTNIGNGSDCSDKSNRRHSNSSQSEIAASNTTAVTNDLQGPSKKHLVERILRLQQASARQTEKIDFLENHTLSLVAELQKKSKVVQYYMLRDQVGALTTNKSDQNKIELAKYGGVMSAIYVGFKNNTNQSSMTLDLSLEINKKLQAVLEDTLLKNITLKENLDVLGLEVDKLTRKLSLLESKD